MDIALINLDRTPDRLAAFVRVNDHLPSVTRYPAVDGRTLDRAALIADGLAEAATLERYTPGALGAACSHLALWAMAVEQARALTICEDDAILSRHFIAAAEVALATLPHDWDIVLWGWNFDSYLGFDMMPGVSTCLASFDQDTMRAGVEPFQNALPAPRLYPLLRAFGTVCYTISPKGAAELRRYCLPLREVPVYFPGLERTLENGGLDVMMNEFYPRLGAYVCFPPLAITPNRHDISTIRPRD